ncbi:hypothetical protein E1956_44475 (plasmid) [Paraburkholderia pallida]|uniref:Uncharacterized protein n=2 Tax=Paraburkholderia pallida TaxID=2547399 RepID=A0A4P7DAF8_9BURK|nr:hypothetical protein E1956_44475 [Paraburkholderia pallida]
MADDGVLVLLDLPDEEVGQLLKRKVRDLRKGLLLLDDAPPLKAIKITPVQIEGVIPTPVKSDVYQQAEKARRRLVQLGELLDSSQLRESLNITKQAVSAATRANRMFTVEVEGQAYYPVFFADGKVDRTVVERVARLLGQLPGWTKWDFFVSRRGSLGDLSALEALGKGKVDLVEKVACAFHEEMTR